MGRGSSSTGGGDLPNGGGGGVNPNNMKNIKDMISNRGQYQEGTDQVLTVARDLYDEYGVDAILPGSFQTCNFVGSDATTLGCYDGTNIFINAAKMDPVKMDTAMQKCADKGYHPPLGNKSGIEAVTAHESGHALTDAVGRKIGNNDIDSTAKVIVNEARKQTKHKGNMDFATKISGYAKTNHAECVAEAVCDVYCNGKKAKPESKAVVKVIKKYLKPSTK